MICRVVGASRKAMSGTEARLKKGRRPHIVLQVTNRLWSTAEWGACDTPPVGKARQRLPLATHERGGEMRRGVGMESPARDLTMMQPRRAGALMGCIMASWRPSPWSEGLDRRQRLFQ